MLKKAVFLVLAFCLLAVPVLAEQVQLKAADQPYTIEVLESDLARTVLQYEINAFDMGTVDIAGREFSLLDLDGRARHMVAGMPELPTLRESIVIPDDASMTLRVLASEYRDFAGVSVAPSKGHITRDIDPATVPYIFGEAYNRDAWYPAATALLDEPYIMRDLRGQVVEVNPFQDTPATETLRVWTKLIVEVEQHDHIAAAVEQFDL